MTPWRRSSLLVLALLLPLFLGGERPVIYLRLTDSLTFDPGKVEDSYSQEVISSVFEGLVHLRSDRIAVEPCLAERWLARENGRHWIFYLRRGVTFHNGAEFTAAAVVYSFKKRLAKRAGEYSSFGRFFPYIMDVRALDNWTVEFLLSRPYNQFLLALVDQRASIVATGSYDGPDFKPVGSGPFVLSEWTKGKSIVLTRFQHYWLGPGQLPKIIFKCEPNSALRLSQIRNFSADINIIRSAKEMDELLGKKEIGIRSEPKLNVFFLGFNCRRPPFSALPARQALFHLLEKKTLIKQIFQKFATPAAGMLPPVVPGFDDQLGRDDFNPEKARSLLRQAGLGGGFSCRLYYSEGQYGLEEVAKAIAINARLVGITVISVKRPFAELLAAVSAGAPDLFLLGWGFAADQGILLNPMFMLFPGSRDSIMAASPRFIQLLARAESTEADAQRLRVYAAAQRQLQEDMPLIPLFYLNHIVAYNKRLHNLRSDPFGLLDFRYASLDAD